MRPARPLTPEPLATATFTCAGGCDAGAAELTGVEIGTVLADAGRVVRGVFFGALVVVVWEEVLTAVPLDGAVCRSTTPMMRATTRSAAPLSVCAPAERLN